MVFTRAHLQSSAELIRKQHIGELGLAIHLKAAIALVVIHIVERRRLGVLVQ
jgi:hypothetical protein